MLAHVQPGHPAATIRVHDPAVDPVARAPEGSWLYWPVVHVHRLVSRAVWRHDVFADLRVARVGDRDGSRSGYDTEACDAIVMHLEPLNMARTAHSSAPSDRQRGASHSGGASASFRIHLGRSSRPLSSASARRSGPCYRRPWRGFILPSARKAGCDRAPDADPLPVGSRPGSCIRIANRRGGEPVIQPDMPTSILKG